jgi:hypothetical protein
MRRSKLGRRASKKIFKKATGVQRINNMNPRVMRGGIRL